MSHARDLTPGSVFVLRPHDRDPDAYLSIAADVESRLSSRCQASDRLFRLSVNAFVSELCAAPASIVKSDLDRALAVERV